MKTNCREASKANWGAGSENCNPSPEEVNRGSLQRIADACELMAKSHQQLINDRDMYKRWYEEKGARCEKLEYSIRAYKATITKLKRQLGSPFKIAVE